MESKLNQILSSLNEQVKDGLAQVITSLESDELLEQMRNDSSLYNEKVKYMQQLIKTELSFDKKLLGQIAQLAEDKVQLQARLSEMKQEYLQQLGKIEIQYKQFLNQKQRQKSVMKQKVQALNSQISQIQKNKKAEFSKIQEKNVSLEDLNEKIQGELKQAKIKIEQFEEEHQVLKQKLKSQNNQAQQNSKYIDSQSLRKIQALDKECNQYKKQKQEISEQLKQAETELKESTSLFEERQSEYQQVIQNMKDDMHLIRQEWEKKCNSIQNSCDQQYRQRLIQNQEDLHKRLYTYMEDLKLGKNIIVQSGQEILESKKIFLEKRYQEDAKRFQVELKESEEKIIKLQSLLRQSKDQIKKSAKSHQVYKEENQRQIEQLQNLHKNQLTKLTKKNIQLQNQIKALHEAQKSLMNDLNTTKHQKQSILKQRANVSEELQLYKEKQSRQLKKIKELQDYQASSKDKIFQMKKELSAYNEKGAMNEKLIQNQRSEINKLHGLLEKLKDQVQGLQSVISKQDSKITQQVDKIKKKESKNRALTSKIDGLFILIRKLSKQLTLVKQEIDFSINVQRSAQSSLIVALAQQANHKISEVQRSCRTKMSQLLNQVQYGKSQDKDEFETIMRANQNLKKELRIMEASLVQKDQDHQYDKERTVNLEVEKCRLQMQEELSKQKKQKRMLQDKIYDLKKKHEYTLDQAEKEVGRSVRGFIAKWESQVSSIEDTLQFKEQHLKETTHQLKKLQVDFEAAKKSLEFHQEKIYKQERKYQALNEERNKTVDEMMKRLEKQTKHKMNLQKQLGQIRGQLVKKSNSYTTSNSPFNNYSFTDRENTGVNVNAFQYPATNDKGKSTNMKSNNVNREKQLSEIREMIAKTYKVTEGPEKDSPINKGKLF